MSSGDALNMLLNKKVSASTITAQWSYHSITQRVPLILYVHQMDMNRLKIRREYKGA